MNILVINGAPARDTQLDSALVRLIHLLEASGHQVTAAQVCDLQIKHCLGCWGCWVKTPSQCVHQDDMEAILPLILKADLLIFASPLILGYPSAVLKQFMDRMIPLVHPYIVMDQGECHHLARYAAYPKMGLFLQKEADTDAEDMAIVHDLFSRVALNMKTTLQFTHTTDEDLQEVCHEINRC